MLPSIMKNLQAYHLYTKEEYEQALNRILQHRQSVIKFQSELESADGLTLNGDYTLARITTIILMTVFLILLRYKMWPVREAYLRMSNPPIQM